MIRTLVIAPQWIGDAVMSEPLLARLAARGERVAVAALPWVAPVYRAIPHVAEVIELPFAHGRLDWAARRRLARAWRGRFDRAYVLPNSIKSALLPWLARIPERVGYRGEGRFGLLNRRLANAGGRPPMVAFYGALADAADPRDGGDASMRETPRLAFADAEIAAAAGAACRVFAGALPLVQAMALIAAARGVVSNDSGLMHVAAAFGVPQVAVFGSTSPLHTPPLSARANVLWLKDELGLDCMPCFERTCRYGHYRCLTSVSAGRVEAALAVALAAPPADAAHATA
jgi:heptosyltransferase-2